MTAALSEGRGAEIAPGALAEALGRGDYEVLRLTAPRFDGAALAAALERVRRRYPLRPKNAEPSYLGICLQTCGDTADPLYGLLNWRIGRFARPAVEPTVIAGDFAAVFEALAPYAVLTRGRLLELHPGHAMPFHTDGPGSRRLHIAIVTSAACRIEFERGGAYHLPADGSCFLVNTERPHRATNASAAPRTHLVFQARSHAAARDARATPKLRATITRDAGGPLDLAALRPWLDTLEAPQAAPALSRATEMAADGTALSHVREFATLDDLGDFLRGGAIERLRTRLAQQGYRLETEIV